MTLEPDNGGWTQLRLRFAVRLNPSKSELVALPEDTEVSFLPMEAIGEDGSLNLELTRPLGEVLSGYSYFRDGDVTVAKITPCFENGKGARMEGLLGSVGFGTTELIVARPRAGVADSSFLHWLFSSPDFRRAGEGEMYGAGGQKRVPDDFVRNYRVALPPLDEQAAIATFLDHEVDKIDALVEEQRRLIELLKEKRQAGISHAVTKGLDPLAATRPSGVAWLGEVPAHWDIHPLKYLTRFESGGTPSKANLDYWDGDVPWVSAKDLKIERLTDTQDHITDRALADGAATLVPAGAVVVLVRGMMLARAFPVVQLDTPMAINQDLKALVRSRLCEDYLAWVLRGLEGESLSRIDEAGHGTKALRMEAWTSMDVPEPPLTEQEAIARHLDTTTRQLDLLSSEAANAVDLLLERRAALISAAVTGKIDVRSLAAADREVAA